MPSLKESLIALVLTVSAFIAGDTVNPQVHEKAKEVVNPPAPVVSPCPSGWDYNQILIGHSVEDKCIQGTVVATLLPPDLVNLGPRKANYALDTASGPSGRRLACAEIPNWPRERCE